MAVLLVCALGSVVLGRHGSSDTAARDASTTGSAPSKDDAGTVDAEAHPGLRAAGIPVPGDWSRQSGYRVTVEDGRADWPEQASMEPMAGSYGVADTALDTLDRLLDPTMDDQAWAQGVLGSLGADGGGVEHPVSDAPRWWWAQRRFDPTALCRAVDSDPYVQGQYRGGCADDGEWDDEAERAVSQAGMYDTTSTDFPVPDGLTVDSLTNPQDVASRAYGVVGVPMDDGIWHVTVYCPATLDGPLTDLDGNELTGLDGRGEAWTSISPTGWGTVQRPCRTVEVTVGGQKPFWWFGDES
ncbi:hypothetical protein [Bifidobacterium tsurumiense]|uniref:hypothetical protein n=1 Tax=Bifidobacterium tsurumiense TaxID=356829 RepID=UPI00126A6AD8|nr:hypothetical protein [Bifidobacterium tsurumiense]